MFIFTSVYGGQGYTWHHEDLKVLEAGLHQLAQSLDSLDLTDTEPAARGRKLLMQIEYLRGLSEGSPASDPTTPKEA
jgi:hypothetical protein